MYALYPNRRRPEKSSSTAKTYLRPNVNALPCCGPRSAWSSKPTPFPMSIFDNVAFGVRLYETLGKAQMSERVEESLRRAALWDEVRTIAQLGPRPFRRTAANVCAWRAASRSSRRSLLLDEPTVGPGSDFEREAGGNGHTTEKRLYYRHRHSQPGQAARVSKYTGFMYLGELVEFGETADIFTKPVTVQGVRLHYWAVRLDCVVMESARRPARNRHIRHVIYRSRRESFQSIVIRVHGTHSQEPTTKSLTP